MKIYYNPKLKKLARYLRNNSTLSEVILWNELKGNRIGYQFMRQKPIGQYIVDFYCAKLRLAIEVDGETHQFRKSRSRDIKKDKFLNKLGIKVCRIDDQDVKDNVDNVIRNLKVSINKNHNII